MKLHNPDKDALVLRLMKIGMQEAHLKTLSTWELMQIVDKFAPNSRKI